MHHRFVFAVGLSIALGAPAAADDSAAHRMHVESQSHAVMPFSLDATKHFFRANASGGTQTVLAIGHDRAQVALIRSHLRKEAAAFAAGDFGDPAAIHGSAMPGLATLRTSRGRLRVRYAEVGEGATILFSSRDAAIVDALHHWFVAQVHDHGSHAAMQM